MDQFLDWIRVRHGHHTAEAHAVGQQIANGDCAQRRHRVGDIRGVDLSTPRPDHRRNCRDELRDRSNAKDRVTLHRSWSAECHRAERFHMKPRRDD
jgi:hypothetical protein